MHAKTTDQERTRDQDHLMRDPSSKRNIVWTILFAILAASALNACSDTNNVSGPAAPATPGPLRILTSSPLPAGASQVDYDITLAASGGAPPYTWSLAPGSPPLPNGLALTSSTGNISGTPTAIGTTPTEFRLRDSKGQSVQKILAITINISPTPLAILTGSLPNGSIHQLYAVALSPTGGTSPYTWDLKSGSPPLPSGLNLSNNGVISGTPTETSTVTHTFTLTDATALTVEKSLQLSINAIPLSITTTSLPQGTANQSYSETLEATGGTGAYTWDLAGGSPALPTGLTLNTSSGAISGIPSGTSNLNHTFTVTDHTPPTPQTATKTLSLVIGAQTPNLVITTTSPLPSGTVSQPYNTVTLTASGGTGAKTWDISNGSLPAGLTLSSSGVISGTPAATGTSSPTFRVRDSGNPQDTAIKQLAITINLPAAPHITTTSFPDGTFNVAYNQTPSVTGGIGTLVWGVTSGALPPGLDLDASNGNISGTPTSTGSFPFRLRVTDSIPQFDQQNFTITINPPAPPSINAFTLPTGTVNEPYSNTQLTATGGALPLTWTVTPALAGGTLTLDPSTGVISGTPTSSSLGIPHTFRVTDSTQPIHQFGELTRTLTINANVTPVLITTTSPLLDGKVGDAYSITLSATGGTGLGTYSWTLASDSPESLPDGLTLTSDGALSGTPGLLSAGIYSLKFTVEDQTSPTPQSVSKTMSLTITPL